MKIGKCELAVRAMMLIVIAGLCLMIAGAAMADKSKPVVVRGKDVIAPKVGEAVDVAPFGEFRSWNNGKDIGVLWEDTREIFKVAVKFADKSAMPDPANVKLQYWKTAWPQERVPRDAVLGSGNWGWIEAGDWYNGKWRDADVDVVVNGDKWTYTFRPINKSEYDDLDKFDATYRTTLKLRILFPEKAPEIAALNTFTDSTWQQTSAIVGWGGTANSSEQIWDGKAEVYNGYLAAVRPLAGSKVNMKDGGNWSSTVKDTTDGVVIDYWYAKPVSMHSFDETVVTVRAKQHNFSFAGREVADGKRIFIRDYGVLLKPVKDATTYADAEAAYQKAQKTVYQKVAELPEQKLERAWSDMPQKGRIYMPVAVE
ncbi:MAG: hypothetical protein Q7N50_01635, partial [Armatimonadota bacterium]|nr:hypothetical protein [Armatimonadota bacterium]